MAGDATYEDFRDANRLIDAAWTAQVRGSANMAKIKDDQAIAAADKQTDYTDVTDLMGKLQAEPAPHTMAMKQSGLTQIRFLACARGGRDRRHDARGDAAPVGFRCGRS